MSIKNRDMVVTMDPSDGGEAGQFTVQLRLGDQMRAELEAKRMGLKGTDMPIHLQGLFAWASMVRSGNFDGKSRAFIDACVSVEDVKDSGETVDPTEQGQSSDSP